MVICGDLGDKRDRLQKKDISKLTSATDSTGMM